MKKIITIILALILVLTIGACGTKQSESTQTPNPMTEVSQDDMCTQTGVALRAPSDATDVKYFVVEDGEKKMAQVSFTMGGKNFSYRAVMTSETTAADTTGLYYKWTTESDTDLAYCAAHYMGCKEAAGLYWIDVVPGVNYSLACSSESDEGEMIAVAELCFEPLQGDAE